MKKLNVVAALIYEDDKILLTSRPDHQEHAGFWEFPGGKIESGETPAQSLKRELKEELDIEVSVYDTVFLIEHQYPDKLVYISFLRCMLLPDETPTALEQQEFAWVKRENLSNYKILPADKPLVNFLSL